MHFQTMSPTNFLTCSACLNMGTIGGTTYIKMTVSFLPGIGKHVTCNALCSSNSVMQLTFCIFSHYPWKKESCDSSVSIVLDDWGSRVRLLAGAGNFSLHHHIQNSSGAYPTSYPMGTRGSFLGGKAAGE
jgi:hypothetical protein